AEDGIIYSGGGNGWFLRGLLSEITGVSEREKLIASELYEVFGSVVELKVDGEIYDPSGRLRYTGKGRVSLPAGVYFVRARREAFKVIVR
ncbi:MAG: T9SS type A sorting domain-containing protein, partial [Thermotogae bacterium]|nr:T9SS type A sorting domain-containing protein [Thermotogota bacterium]